MRRPDLRGDDGGAVLILALIFVTVVGLIGGALIGFAGSSLAQTNVLNADRSQSYAAQSAVQVAIQAIRDLPANTTPGATAVDGSLNTDCPMTTVPIPGEGESFHVMCGLGKAPRPFERSITFVACTLATTANNCFQDLTTGPSADFTPKPQYPGAIVVATVTFDDLKEGCHEVDSACPLSLGTEVDVSNWNIAKSND